MWKAFLSLLAAAFLFGVISAGYWIYKQVDSKEQVQVERLEKFKNRKPRNDLPHIGYLAPKIELPNHANETVTLASTDAKPILVVFWASWSSHCQAELEKLEKEYKAKGKEIRFLLVNDTENDDETAANKLVETKGLHATLLYDRTGDVVEDYGIEVYPTSFLIGSDGKIADRWTGSIEAAEWDKKLAAILDQKKQ